MAMKSMLISYQWVLLLVIVHVAITSSQVINPEADVIDEEAFKEAHRIDNDIVAGFVKEIADAKLDLTTIVDFDIATRCYRGFPPPEKCEVGPATTIFEEEDGDTFLFPPIRISRCRGPCPNRSPCLARKTVTRNVWAIVYKRFNCWGLLLWIPVDVHRFCIQDQTCCECKACSDIIDYKECVKQKPCPDACNNDTFCYWKPCRERSLVSGLGIFNSTAVQIDEIANSVVEPEVWGSCDCCKITLCGQGQVFDRRTCSCQCKPVKCREPLVQDLNTCQCVCPRESECGPRTMWNSCTCQCECKQFSCFSPRVNNSRTCECDCPPIRCPPPLEQDPATCQCKCPKDIVCRPGEVVNQRTCRCECPCCNIVPQDVCENTACANNRRCRWFPNIISTSTGLGSNCRCNCCERINNMVTTDCGAFSPLGSTFCNANSNCIWRC